MTTLHGALIELFEIDLSNQGGSIIRWHNGSNEFGGDVIFGGVEYNRIPIEAKGFDVSGQGKLPRPSLRIANVNQVIGGISRAYGELIGCKVTRRRVFAKYLDAVNFTNGNPSADPEAEFPPDIFYVDRKTSEDKFEIQWELASAMDLEGVQLPRRQIIANVCPWVFPPTVAHPECPYAGILTTCDHTLHGPNGCEVHFGDEAELPFGGFPGAGLGYLR